MGAYTDKNLTLDVNQEQGSIQLAVVNQVGAKLPVTGSQAMMFLIAAGVLLIVVSAWRGKKQHE